MYCIFSAVHFVALISFEGRIYGRNMCFMNFSEDDQTLNSQGCKLRQLLDDTDSPLHFIE